jgi:hypothetical protein
VVKHLARFVAAIYLGIIAPGTSFGITPLPLCPGDQKSSIYTLTVSGEAVAVGTSQFNGGRGFHVAAFETEVAVRVRLEAIKRSLSGVRVRPQRAERDIRVGNGVVEFDVAPGEKVVVEADKAPPLFLFMLPVEKNKPQPRDENVIYFGPGEHTAGEIRLRSGQTLYLAAGARVRGRVYALEAHNVSIRGRGILDARGYTDPAQKTSGILFERCRNVAMDGIQIRTGDWWQILLLLTDHVRINHVQTLSFGKNNDGIDTDGVNNLEVRDSFLGCGDDGFGIHAVDAVTFGEPATSNCLAERCVIWNEFAGNGLRIGASTETSEIRDITFRNVDVLHCINNAIMIDHSDWAKLRRIVFDDFDNDTPQPLANIAIMKSFYSNDTGYRNERGMIEDLLFHNVRSAGGGITIRGADNNHAVRGVRLANVVIQDKLVRAPGDLSIGPHVYDVSFSESSAPQPEPPRSKLTSRASELTLDEGAPGCWVYAGSELKTIRSEDSHGGAAWQLNKLGRGHAAVYEPQLEGMYEISAYWGSHDAVATAAPWTVFHKGGYTTRLLDQNHSAGWHTLGEFELGSGSWVRLVDPLYPLSNGPVIADAVRFRRVGARKSRAED